MKKSQASSKQNSIHQPHDKTLFKALENIEVAKDAIRAYLDPDLLKQVNFSNYIKQN